MQIDILFQQFVSTSLESPLLSLYRNPQHAERFLVGQCIICDQQEILMSSYEETGAWDGFCLCKTSSIFRIERQTAYLRGLTHSTSPWIQVEAIGDAWASFWNLAITNKLIVQIQYKINKTMYGFPITFTENTVKIQRVCRDGHVGSLCWVNKAYFLLASCESTEDREIMERWRNRNETD